MAKKRRRQGDAAGRHPGDFGYRPTRAQGRTYNEAFRRATWPRMIHYRIRDRYMAMANYDVTEAIRLMNEMEGHLLGMQPQLQPQQANNTGNLQPQNPFAPPQNPPLPPTMPSQPQNFPMFPSIGQPQLPNLPPSSYRERTPMYVGPAPLNTTAYDRATRAWRPEGFGIPPPAPGPVIPPNMAARATNSAPTPRMPASSGSSGQLSRTVSTGNTSSGPNDSDKEMQEHLADVDTRFPLAETITRMQALPRVEGNIEEERRAAAVSLRNSIQQVHGVRLAISEAILLLHLAQWDIGQAESDFSTLDEARDRLHVQFDRMRSSEGTRSATEVAVGGPQERQSERLALMLSITNRPDWKSVLALLEANKFDLVKTLLAWFTTGMPIAVKKSRNYKKDRPTPTNKQSQRGGNKVDTRKDACDQLIPLPSPTSVTVSRPDNRWAREPTFFRRVPEFQGSEDLIPVPDLRDDDRFRAFGFLIHPNRDPLQPGRYHVEDLFVVEYISKNRYWYSRFAKPTIKIDGVAYKFKWPHREAASKRKGKKTADDAQAGNDQNASGKGKSTKTAKSTKSPKATTDKEVTFDFSDKHHVEALNNWRRQNFSRSTGIKVRGSHQEWQPIELAKLRQLVHDWWEEWAESKPDLAATDDYNLPITRNQLQEWADVLNALFLGTRPGDNAQLRAERTWESVGTQLRRTAPITEHYHIAEDKGYFKQRRDDFPKEQEGEVAHGDDLLKSWDPAAERKKTKQSGMAIPSKNTASKIQANLREAKSQNVKKKPLPMVDDTVSDDNDSDATKERKLHAKRSRAKLFKLEAARLQARALNPVQDDGRDVMKDWRGKDGRGKPLQKKRKVDGGDGDGGGDDGGAGDESEDDDSEDENEEYEESADDNDDGDDENDDENEDQNEDDVFDENSRSRRL